MQFTVDRAPRGSWRRLAARLSSTVSFSIKASKRSAQVALVTCAAAITQFAYAAFPDSVFTNLDYGIYWYGLNNAAQKQVDGVSNPYFNANKPTVIFIHGWQNGATQKKKREDFNRTAFDAPADVAASWINAGWNVGIYYWNQFADEGEVKDAEAKIWSINGPKQMRWRNASGVYSPGPAKNATELFLDSYKSAMRNYVGNNVRLAGHSLGNQVAVHATTLILNEVAAGRLPAAAKPTRVALLDPAYLKDGRDYLGGKWTGEVAREQVSAAKAKGVIFEAYRSSGATSNGFVGDANTGLLKMCAFVELRPWQYGAFDFSNKHNVVVAHYFWSHAFAAPRIHNSSDLGASAATSDSRIRDLMNSTKSLLHRDGKYTTNPSDDVHEYQNR
jgi:pimeloyl-ACP methyl ester carboxylesterase